MKPLIKPIAELVIKNEKIGDGYTELVAKLGGDGRLVLEEIEAGTHVKERWGDSDEEHWLTVSKEFAGTVFLHLVKERFGSAHDMLAWLKEKEIPCDFLTM
jgi:hypothetical protein